MKKNLNAITRTISDKLNKNNVKDIASALWFELQLDKKTGQLDHLLDKIRQEMARRDKTLVAKVISRERLGADVLEQIKDKLEKKYSQKIQLVNTVDLDVLGGFKIQIQDEVIDLSWREKLNSIKTRMAGTNE